MGRNVTPDRHKWINAIGALSAAEHITLDEMLRRLARAERQRRIGAELAAHQATSTERAIIAVGLATLEHHARIRSTPADVV